MTEALNQMIELGDVKDCGAKVFFLGDKSYKMGDYGRAKPSSSENKKQLVSVTAKHKKEEKILEPKTQSLVCYYTVGNLSEAKMDGFFPILIKKSSFESLVLQKKNLVFVVKTCDNTYLFSKGARSIFKAVKKAPDYYSVDNSLWGFVLNGKNGELWSIKGTPRLKVCDCGMSKTKKNIPNSPEVADFLEFRKKEFITLSSTVVDKAPISQRNKSKAKKTRGSGSMNSFLSGKQDSLKSIVQAADFASRVQREQDSC